MILVISEAIRTKGVADAIQTVHIAFTLVGNSVDFAGDKEVGLQKRL